MDKKPLEEKVLKDLIKKGLKTENTTLEHLKKAGFSVVTQYPFVDPTSNKVRSVDVKAIYSELSEDKSRLNKIMILFIDCKKSDTHKWVFYTELSSLEIERVFRDIALLPESVLGKLIRPSHRTTDIWARISECKLGVIHMSALNDKPKLFLDAQMKILKAI